MRVEVFGRAGLCTSDHHFVQRDMLRGMLAEVFRVCFFPACKNPRVSILVPEQHGKMFNSLCYQCCFQTSHVLDSRSMESIGKGLRFRLQKAKGRTRRRNDQNTRECPKSLEFWPRPMKHGSQPFAGQGLFTGGASTITNIGVPDSKYTATVSDT